MEVGLNYPHAWNVYGRYFGAGNPPGAEPLMNAWTDNLRRNLVTLRDALGMKVVRIFLLCNAHNYGSAAPGAVEQPREVPRPMLEHLVRMFEAFEATRMRVIPSLVDFKAFGRSKLLRPAVFGPGRRGTPVLVKPAVGNGCGDRDAVLTDPEQRRHFLDEVVASFAAAARPFEAALYAFEVMNEPRWNIGARVNPDHIAGGLKIPKADMVDFLSRALGILCEHGLPSTVGHRFYSDFRDMPAGTLPQFHYYPLRAGRLGPWQIPRALDPILKDRRLEPAHVTRAFLGEIGTHAAHGEPWPELYGADARGVRERVRERLTFVRSRGYPLVLLWPDRDGEVFNPGLPGGGPDPVHLTQEAQRGVVDFMKHA